MRHLLHDPAFPDIVGAWAESEGPHTQEPGIANDNRRENHLIDINDPLFELLVWLEIDATRLW